MNRQEQIEHEAKELLDVDYFDDDEYWNLIVERENNLSLVSRIIRTIDKNGDLAEVESEVKELKELLLSARYEIATERLDVSVYCDHCPGIDTKLKFKVDIHGRHVMYCPKCNSNEFIFSKDKIEAFSIN